MKSAAVHTQEHCAGPPLTLEVCSNNPGRVQAHSLRNLTQLGPEDRLLIVFDVDDERRISAVANFVRLG